MHFNTTNVKLNTRSYIQMALKRFEIVLEVLIIPEGWVTSFVRIQNSLKWHIFTIKIKHTVNSCFCKNSTQFQIVASVNGAAIRITDTALPKHAISESPSIDAARYPTLLWADRRLLPVCLLVRSINAVRVISDVLHSTSTIVVISLMNISR